MQFTEQLSALQEAVRTLQEENHRLQAENAALRTELEATQQRLAEVEQKRAPVPTFVKANVPARPKKERKKRAPQYNRARRREPPTQVVEHRLDRCPHCAGRLSSLILARRRQVIELPPPPPVNVTEHQVYRGWCSYCRAWQEAPLDLHGQVLGQGRLGVGIASLVAHLRTVVRAPIRMIQAVLLELYGLRVSVGELVDLLRRVAQAGEPAVADLRAEARASPALHADETGWRENGRNGYIWSLATRRLRYFEYHQSRAGAVVRELLGSTFEGVLESDFYAAYNEYAGLHQRCWVHLLRDIHHLKEQHPTDEALLGWAAALKDLYHRACAERGPDPALPRAAQERLRRELQHAYEQELWHVCAPYLGSTTPMHTLCKRVERFLPELFVFLLIPEAVPDNNEAERSVRPLVIARKISGGSRSPQGSRTRMVLSSLFGTWQVRGLNPREECHHLLSQQSPLPQV